MLVFPLWHRPNSVFVWCMQCFSDKSELCFPVFSTHLRGNITLCFLVFLTIVHILALLRFCVDDMQRNV